MAMRTLKGFRWLLSRSKRSHGLRAALVLLALGLQAVAFGGAVETTGSGHESIPATTGQAKGLVIHDVPNQLPPDEPGNEDAARTNGQDAPAALVSQPAPAEKSVDISGYADLYYQVDFGRPKSGQPVNGRSFDVNHDTYRLAAAQIDISKAPTTSHRFGFNLSLLVGPTAKTLASTEPGGIDTYKDFAQAYVSYRAPTRIPLTIDFGKWNSFIGYEGIDSRIQDNYSRSFAFTALEPGYMTGARASATVSPKLTVNAYAYQGFNEVKNSNRAITFGLGLVYSLTDQLALTLQGYSGREGSARLNESGSYGGIGFPTPGTSWVNHFNPILVYQPNSKDKFAFDGNYASATGKGNWNGAAIYYRRQIDSRNAICFRAERAEDSAGLRFGAGGMLLHSLTATYDYNLNRNVLLRFELRQDLASHPFFNSDSVLSEHRTTLTFAQIIKF